MKPRIKALTQILASTVEAHSAIQMCKQGEEHIRDLPLMQRVRQAEEVLVRLKEEVQVILEKELK